MRWLIFLSLLLGAAAGYLYWFAASVQAPPPPPPPPPVVLGVGSLELTLENWEISTTTESSEIRVGLEDPGPRRAEVISFVERTLYGYADMIDPAAMPGDELSWLRESGRRYEFSADGKLTQGEGGRSSYRLEISYDTGGAHPNSATVAESYEPDGRKLSLEDAMGGDRSLARLADATRPRLLTQIREWVGEEPYEPDEDFEAGTAPSPENYASWYLSGGDIVVVFGPYQVGPYTIGSYDVAVPIAEV